VLTVCNWQPVSSSARGLCLSSAAARGGERRWQLCPDLATTPPASPSRLRVGYLADGKGEEWERGECRSCPSCTCTDACAVMEVKCPCSGKSGNTWFAPGERWPGDVPRRSLLSPVIKAKNLEGDWAAKLDFCLVSADGLILCSKARETLYQLAARAWSGCTGRQGRGYSFPTAREGASRDELLRLRVSRSVQPPSSKGPKALGGCAVLERGAEASVQTGSAERSPEMGHKLRHIQASGTCDALSPWRNSVVPRLGWEFRPCESWELDCGLVYS